MNKNEILNLKVEQTIYCFLAGKKENVKKVVLEATEKIGANSFRNFRSLRTISLPDTLTSIEENAFWECRNLKDINLPDRVKNIGFSAFRGCRKLESIDIPDSVTTIREQAFKSCENLKSIRVPDSVTTIEKGTFANCRKLESIDIPDSVTTIREQAFEGCERLENIKIPEGVTSIGEGAFRYCLNLKSIRIPDSVTTIRRQAFEGCESLKSIRVPDSVTTIEGSAFASCRKLESIDIPDSCNTIGFRAFAECESLKSIRVPDSVTTIGEQAFEGCRQAKLSFQGNEYVYLENAELRPMSEGLLTGFGLKGWVELNSKMSELGIHPFYEKDWAEPSTEEIEGLSQAFREKFGRAPKVINEIALAQKILNLETEDIVKNFSVEGFKEALKKSDNCPFVAITALLGAGKNLLHKFPIATSYEMELATVNVRNWIRKHPDSFELLPRLKGMEQNIENLSVTEVKELLVTQKARNELKKIERKYDFAFADCRCEIKQCSIEHHGVRGYILQADDCRQITVGYDTYCCQHLEGVGESSMIYGLMSPTAGFWVIEDQAKGKVKAQAEVWLSEDKQTFVFDNIEFANDREVGDFEEVIKSWVRECPYPNVVLGMGYTEISLPCPECQAPSQPPVEGLKHVYTDTHRCVQLKKDGELTW